MGKLLYVVNGMRPILKIHKDQQGMTLKTDQWLGRGFPANIKCLK